MILSCVFFATNLRKTCILLACEAFEFDYHPSETVNNIILNIVQTNIFGNSILDTMYNQIEFLRDKQILQIKEKINKIPNKVSIISVIFIVPLILLLILGPFVIEFLGM